VKAYTTKRPDIYVYVQWDGSNLAEFQAMLPAQWGWMYMTGVPEYIQNGTDLEVWTSGQLFATVPLNSWFNGNVFEDLNSLPSNEAIVPDGIVHYVVEQD
jgi:hypothetical protein